MASENATEHQMKSKDRLIRGTALLALLAVAGAAQAKDGTGFYAGANIGITSSRADTAGASRDLATLGFSSSVSAETSSIGSKVFGGYGFTPNWAVEAGYFDAGKVTLTAITFPSGRLHQSITATGLNVDGVFRYPFMERFGLLARVGVIHAETDITITGSGAISVIRPHVADTKTSWKVGLGAEYRDVSGVALRAEWERYRLPNGFGGEVDVDMLSLGFLYRF
jgi:OmpA-OmpF porin, OOP family